MTLDEFRSEVIRRKPVTTAEEIRERLAGREAEAQRRIRRVIRRRGPRTGPKAPGPEAPRQSAAPPRYVRLTQSCLSRTFHTYLKAGSKGQVVGRDNGKLSVLFVGTLAVIAEDSHLIEVVK